MKCIQCNALALIVEYNKDSDPPVPIYKCENGHTFATRESTNPYSNFRKDAYLIDELGLLQQYLTWANYKSKHMSPYIQTVLILCGIPTSGKSTFALHLAFPNPMWKIISRDLIRIDLFGLKYKQNSKDEKTVTTMFNLQLNRYLFEGYNVILDNCHCKESYITELETLFKTYSYVEVKVKYFDISLIKAFYRNIVRYFRTKKWIPFKVIRAMKKNYDKINRANHKNFDNL